MIILLSIVNADKLSFAFYCELHIVRSVRNDVAVFICNINCNIGKFRAVCREERVGRKLDFLVQEFNREANTVCSKSNDLAVTNAALALKNEIEKIREQVQNIE